MEKFDTRLNEADALMEAGEMLNRLRAKYAENKGRFSGKQYDEVARKIFQEYKKAVFNKRGVEQDPDGRVVLYHATTADALVDILKDKMIDVPKNTGARTWGMSFEKDDLAKQSKIYLATKKSASDIAHMIQGEKGGSVFILKTKVDEGKLVPDEDTQAVDWLASLDYQGTCSHEGGIDNFKIEERLVYQLPKARVMKYLNRPRKNEEEETAVYAEIQKETEENAREEEKRLKKAGYLEKEVSAKV